MSYTVTPAMQAASLILMRRSPDGGAPEILVVVRATTLRFGGGAFAFPGGRVDPADIALAERYPSLSRDDAAARIAALRETWEETGIAIGFAPPPPGARFQDAMADQMPDIAPLAPFARWCPPEDAPRRFDTRFYVASVADTAEPIADGVETAAAFWSTAAAVRDRWLAGDGRALFPTRRLIERLTTFANPDAAVNDPLSSIDHAVVTTLEHRADEVWLTIPKDAGYPVWEERITEETRY